MSTFFGIDEDKLTDDAFVVRRYGHNEMLWSIHWKHDEDEHGNPKRYLNAGTSEKDADGNWLRPNDDDNSAAIDTLFGNPMDGLDREGIAKVLVTQGVITQDVADAVLSGKAVPFIGDTEDCGPPRNALTGEVMPEEMQRELARMLRSGDANIIFGPGVKEQMEKDGLTEDDLMAVMRRSVKALDS